MSGVFTLPRPPAGPDEVFYVTSGPHLCQGVQQVKKGQTVASGGPLHDKPPLKPPGGRSSNLGGGTLSKRISVSPA